MKKEKKGKDFLHLPTYPGGKKAFAAFITQNLRYPAEALENKIEGRVHLSFTVNDNGQVTNAIVTKSLGYGCDEEALRLVRLLQYDKVKNRGLRVMSTIKTYIDFRMPKPQPAKLQYTVVKKTDTPPEEKKESGATYSYTIRY